MSNYIKPKKIDKFLENISFIGPTFTALTSASPETAVVPRLSVGPDGECYIHGGNFLNVGRRSGINGVYKLDSDLNPSTNFMYNAFYTSTGTSKISGPSIVREDSSGVYFNANYTSSTDLGINRLVKFKKDGTLDYTFIDNAVRTGTTSNFNNSITGIEFASGNKIVIGGNFTNYKTAVNNYLIRLNQDGTSDFSFNSNATASLANCPVSLLAVDSSDSVIVTGFDYNINGYYVRKLNSDGTLNAAFNSNTAVFASGDYRSIFIQSDGKIIITGFFGYKSYGSVHLIRLNQDGTEDTEFTQKVSFADGTRSGSPVDSSSAVYCVVETPDNKLYFSGIFSNWNQVNPDGYAGVISFNADLTLNSSFNDVAVKNGGTSLFTYGGFDGQPIYIALRNNQLVVSGAFINYKSVPYLNYCVFLNPVNGELDLVKSSKVSRFGTRARKFHGVVSTVVYSPIDNSYIFGGAFTDFGTLCYGWKYAPVNSIHYDITYSTSSAGKILKLSNSGIENQTFSFNTTTPTYVEGYTRENRFTGTISQLQVLSSGAILVAGSTSASYFNQGGLATIYGFGKINSDGTSDNTFNSQLLFSSGESVQSFFVQSNGQILVGGSFTDYGTGITHKNRLLRLNANGTEDTVFTQNAVRNGTSSAKISGNVNAVNQLSDGRIIFGGTFANYSSLTGVNRLAIVSSSGTIGTSETTFINNAVRNGTTAKFNNTISAIAEQPDGKIIVAGNFTSYGGNTSYNRIVRFNTDGTLDTTFMNNVQGKFTIGSITRIRIEDTGHIFVCGSFTYASTPFNSVNLVRLNSDGSRDETSNFNALTSSNLPVAAKFSNSVNDILKISSGDYIVVGAFSNYAPSFNRSSMIWNFDKYDSVVIFDKNGYIK